MRLDNLAAEITDFTFGEELTDERTDERTDGRKEISEQQLDKTFRFVD